MLQKEQLTNEALKKHFKDNFELAHFRHQRGPLFD